MRERCATRTFLASISSGGGVSYAAGVLPLLRRLALPLVLGALAVGAWLLAGQLELGEETIRSAATPAEAATQVLTTRRLGTALVPVEPPEVINVDTVLADLRSSAPTRSCAAISESGTDRLAVRADVPLAPGYSQLFLTGFAALELLGPDYGFATNVTTASAIGPDGTVSGAVTLTGGGDPVLSTSDAIQGSTAWTSLELLADSVVGSGVRRIDGQLLVDDSRYDDQRTIAGWSPDWPQTQLIGLLGALQVNDGAPDPDNLGDPAVLAGRHLAALLADRGVEVTQGVARSAATAEGSENSQPNPTALGQVTSPSLHAIVGDMWQRADPTTAELLLKELGFTAASDGSSAAGGLAVQQLISALDLELALSPRDGSGLDPTAQLSCGLLVDMMQKLSRAHPAVPALAAVDAPAFDGQFATIDPALGVGVVGGGTSTARGVVGRVQSNGNVVTFASLINNADQLSPSEVLFQTQVVQAAALIAEQGE